MSNFTHYQDFALAINRVSFNEHRSEMRGACSVKIYEARLFRPNKSTIPR
jgi:hypothetical protein